MELVSDYRAMKTILKKLVYEILFLQKVAYTYKTSIKFQGKKAK